MARGRGRGGYQRPSNPAAVSGPGASSARTDGRAPVMPVTGLPYGQNQEVNAQQSAAPMGAPAGPGGGGGAPAGGAGRPMGPDGIFGGTERPGEPMTAGAMMGPGAPGHTMPSLPDDNSAALRALIAEAPPHLTDYLLRLLD